MKKLIFLPIFLGIFVYGGGDITPIVNYDESDEYIDEFSGDYQDEYIDEPDLSSSEDIVDSGEEVISDEEDREDNIVEDEIITPTPMPTPLEPQPTPISTPTPPIKPISDSKGAIANGLYVGLGISGARYKDSCYCDTKKGRVKVENKDKTLGVMGRVGYDFNQYVGVEMRGYRTNWRSDGTRVSHIGAFLKPMMPVSNNANVYGLVGVAKTKTKGSMPHVDTTAVALGAGVEVDLSKDIPKEGRYNRDFDGHGDQESGLGVFLDYERMVVRKDAPILDAVSAGISYDF